MDLDWKNLGLRYWVRISFMTFRLELEKCLNTLLLSDWFYYISEWDLKSTQTNLLELEWFYPILDLDLKNTCTNWLDSDGCYYNQARMLLEKYENLRQWSFKQAVSDAIKFCKLEFLMSDYVWWVKNQMLLVTKLFRSNSNLTRLKS